MSDPPVTHPLIGKTPHCSRHDGASQDALFAACAGPDSRAAAVLDDLTDGRLLLGHLADSDCNRFGVRAIRHSYTRHLLGAAIDAIYLDSEDPPSATGSCTHDGEAPCTEVGVGEAIYPAHDPHRADGQDFECYEATAGGSDRLGIWHGTTVPTHTHAAACPVAYEARRESDLRNELVTWVQQPRGLPDVPGV